MINCLVVGAGGFIGAVLRYLISLIPLGDKTVFPYKTLAINILGAFVIGIITSLVLRNSQMDPKIVLFIKVGICGGFTTFSTFALETFDLFKSSMALLAIIYIILSVTLSILAVYFGMSVIR